MLEVGIHQGRAELTGNEMEVFREEMIQIGVSGWNTEGIIAGILHRRILHKGFQEKTKNSPQKICRRRYSLGDSRFDRSPDVATPADPAVSDRRYSSQEGVPGGWMASDWECIQTWRRTIQEGILPE